MQYIIIFLAIACSIYLSIEFWSTKPAIAIFMWILCIAILFREYKSLKANK
jgi:hypothetical protein